MGVKLTFELEFTSDYHIGAGYGKGFGVDAAILREADGTPVIRGSALVGLLRSGTEQLLGLQPLQKNFEHDPLERLFGSPARPKRWFVGSARPGVRLPVDRDSQDVQRVRIDPRTRRAMPRKLFSQEEGRAGQVFQFTAECPDADEFALDEAALLVAAARNIRQLGRSRRRGLGECLVRLVDVTGVAETPGDWQEWFLDRFERVWIQGTPAFRLEPDGKTYRVEDSLVASSRKNPVRLQLIVRLDEPLIIANRAPAGNQFDARDAIPGGVILGALAAITAQRNDLTDPDVYGDFVSLFLRGNVTFPTLYPAHEIDGDLYPSVPAPLGLLTCSVVPFYRETEGHGAYPATSLSDKEQRCPRCDSRMESVQEYVLLKDSWPYTLIPQRSSELHIQIDKQSGRVREGQLYGYTVLNAGQYFVGELICADDKTWFRLQGIAGIAERIPLNWRLGKARRRGYGKVTAWLKRNDDGTLLWIQLPLTERVPNPKDRLSLTLLTDTIIVNRWGQQVTGFDEAWLEQSLDLGPLKIEEAYARTRVVDGFREHLGLPRWRDTALVAGSVIWFTLQDPPDDWQERMKKVEMEGIGARRSEGLGRVVFNHPIYDRREALTESNLELDAAMRLEGSVSKDALIEKWEDKLEEMPQGFDSHFTAIARWLHANSYLSPAELRAKIAELGQLDRQAIELLGGDKEYGKRHTLKPEQDRLSGHLDIRHVTEMLEQLETTFAGHKEFFPVGIQMLADRIAAKAGQEQEA